MRNPRLVKSKGHKEYIDWIKYSRTTSTSTFDTKYRTSFDLIKDYKIKINKKVNMDNKNLINDVLNGIYNNLELRRTAIPCFISDPGLNKSTTIRQFAKEKGVKLVPLILSQRNPNEISGTMLPTKDEKMKYFDYDLLVDMKDGDILFVDEILNANTMVLNACLTILMERELISGKKLPDIMIVAASNPQGATRLTPQQKQRFVFYNLNLDKDSFKEYLQNKYQLTDTMFKAVLKIVREEKFTSKEYNYSSARSIDLAISMMIAGVPTPYANKLQPILETFIENEMDEDITLKDGTIFKKKERISWLELKQKNL